MGVAKKQNIGFGFRPKKLGWRKSQIFRTKQSFIFAEISAIKIRLESAAAAFEGLDESALTS